MSPDQDPASDAQLKARADTADLMEALAVDADGSFFSDLNSYLSAWQARIGVWQSEGVSRGEYESLTKLSGAIQTAESVLNFFVKLKQLPAAQTSEN